jgi:hypothetical protein
MGGEYVKIKKEKAMVCLKVDPTIPASAWRD